MQRRRMIALTLAVCLAGPALAEGKPWFFATEGLALSGYDAVAYLREERAVRGSADHALMWKGATWLFVSEDNRAAFEMNPMAYAPQYGGYCAFAVSNGYTAATDPEAFAVHDGRLYLNYSQRVQRMWERDRSGHIASADANWPKVLGD